jgi:hypothetical protein
MQGLGFGVLAHPPLPGANWVTKTHIHVGRNAKDLWLAFSEPWSHVNDSRRRATMVPLAL